MAVTPYLKLQKPPFDSIPWDQAINGNMDILDSTIAQFLSVPGYIGVWANGTAYITGQVVLDTTSATMWQCLVSHTSAVAPTTFAQDRTAHPTYWLNTTTAPVAPVDQHNVGRNLLHNSLFNIAQRGVGPFTTSFLNTADRWAMQFVSDTSSVSVVALADADRAVIGDESARFCLQNVFVGNAAAGAYGYVMQKIEQLPRLSGTTITASFWARTASGTPKLGINIQQYFGTGGSPSASVWALATGNAVTLSTTWTRYVTTIAIPSITGKVRGTNNDESTQLSFFCSSGATNNATAGNVGVQSGTISIWGVQLEVGSVATPLEKSDPQQDLAKCQRFFSNDASAYWGGAGTNGIAYAIQSRLPVTMRAVPVVTLVANNSLNMAGVTMAGMSSSVIQVSGTANATGAVVIAASGTAAADL